MNSNKIEDRLREIADDPLRFDDLLVDWNSAFREGERSPVTTEMERAADDALIQIAAREHGDPVSGRLHQLLHGLPHAALVVDSTGVIEGMNAAAMRRTVLGPGDSIDALDYALDAAEPISAVIERSLRGRNSDGEVALVRATQTEADRSATLAIVPSLQTGTDPQALVFLIDPEWRSEVEALVARAYHLTEAEIAVLMAFLDGHSTAEIAKARGTSLVTVRTQFQRLMEKTGAHTQAELMRNTLPISQFFQDIAPITTTARHPHRKSFDVMRPGGRSLDVTLAGDMQGLPVVLLSTLSRHTLPDWYERELAEGGILAIHLWRPGFGGSDPLPLGGDLAQGMAEDILAPLDQLQIKRCPIICFDTSIVDGLRLVHHTGDRITRILSYSTFIPLGFRKPEWHQIPWATAMSWAAKTSPQMLRLIIIAGNKAWQTMGSRRFARLQLGASQADLKTIDLPGIPEALEAGLLGSMAQGLDENVRTLQDSFGDWSADLAACPIPVEIVHGIEDPNVPIRHMRHFVSEVASDVTLTEVSDGGYLSLYQYPQVLIGRVRAAHGVLASCAPQGMP